MRVQHPSSASRACIALSIAGLMAGCIAEVDQRGHLPTPDKMAEIQPGSTTKEDVVKILGTPSSTGVFDDKSWYYISKRTSQIAFLSPETLDQQVYVIDFDDKGVVKDVEHKGLDDGRSITPAPGATPSPGRELTFLEQIIGNVGRFNKGGGGGGSDTGTGGQGPKPTDNR